MQSLSTLISEPTENERKAFAAITSVPVTFNAGELALIQRALSAFEQSLHFESGKAYANSCHTKPFDSGKARELRFISEQLCNDALDARVLAEKISKVHA